PPPLRSSPTRRSSDLRFRRSDQDWGNASKVRHVNLDNIRRQSGGDAGIHRVSPRRKNARGHLTDDWVASDDSPMASNDGRPHRLDRKSTRLNSSHGSI